jgi:hypothetical protein
MIVITTIRKYLAIATVKSNAIKGLQQGSTAGQNNKPRKHSGSDKTTRKHSGDQRRDYSDKRTTILEEEYVGESIYVY